MKTALAIALLPLFLGVAACGSEAPSGDAIGQIDNAAAVVGQCAPGAIAGNCRPSTDAGAGAENTHR